MSNLTCQISEQSNGLVLKLGGQFTTTEVDAFNAQAAHIAERNPTRLVIDMADVSALSSAGIGALLMLQRRALEHKCDLRLAALQKNIQDVIRHARLDMIFTISPSTTEAMC